jgi:UDP-3-O-[3-hydroxymyristoyl] glucosamine N-acyltransferase
MLIHSAQDLAVKLNGRLIGQDCSIDGVASLKQAGTKDVSFFYDPKFFSDLLNTQAGCVVVQEMPTLSPSEVLPSCAFIIVPHAKEALRQVLLWHRDAYQAAYSGQLAPADQREMPSGVVVGCGTMIGPNVQLADKVTIGAYCVLEGDITLGPGTVVGHHTVLKGPLQVGSECVIGHHCVLGGDGFGFVSIDKAWQHLPHIGSVVLGDSVQLGNYVSIDKGLLEPTRLDRGIKIDSHVHVGHNATLGEHTIIAGYTALGGCISLGKGCMIGGGCGLADHLHVVDGVTLLGGSRLVSSIRQPGVYGGASPVQEASLWRRNYVWLTRLDALFRKKKKIHQ